MAELKPCPFCGSPAELLHTKTWDYFVRCTDRGCAARTRQYHENETGAVNAWNARAEQETHDVSDQPLRFMCDACGGVSLEIVPSYCPCCGRKVVER